MYIITYKFCLMNYKQNLENDTIKINFIITLVQNVK
jgi:hypothetical protein